MKHFSSCKPVVGFARPVVQRGGDRVEVFTAVTAEIGALGEVLPEQSVGVLVAGPLPWGVRVAEVDWQPRGLAQLRMLRHLGSLVPGQRASQRGGQVGNRGGYRFAHRFCAVASQCWTLLEPRACAVAV